MSSEETRRIVIHAPVLGENWANISDPVERRRAQNRVAQRGYRKRLRKEAESNSAQGTQTQKNTRTKPVGKKNAQRPPTPPDSKLLVNQSSATQQANIIAASHPSTPNGIRSSISHTYSPQYQQSYLKQQQHTPPPLSSDLQPYNPQLDCGPLDKRAFTPSPEDEHRQQQGFLDLEAPIPDPMYSNPHMMEQGSYHSSAESGILGHTSTPPISSAARLTPPGSTSPPRSTDAHGHTALHRAALHGHKSVLAVLLQAGADPTLPDSTGLTPLHLATQQGHTQEVQLLLSSGSSQPWEVIRQVTHTGETALHLAVQAGQPAVLRILLEHSARAVNFQDWLGRTALHVACESNQSECVEMLVQAGAQLDIRDFEGQSLLHSICMGGV